MTTTHLILAAIGAVMLIGPDVIPAAIGYFVPVKEDWFPKEDSDLVKLLIYCRDKEARFNSPKCHESLNYLIEVVTGTITEDTPQNG